MWVRSRQSETCGFGACSPCHPFASCRHTFGVPSPAAGVQEIRWPLAAFAVQLGLHPSHNRGQPWRASRPPQADCFCWRCWSPALWVRSSSVRVLQCRCSSHCPGQVAQPCSLAGRTRPPGADTAPCSRSSGRPHTRPAPLTSSLALLISCRTGRVIRTSSRPGTGAAAAPAAPRRPRRGAARRGSCPQLPSGTRELRTTPWLRNRRLVCPSRQHHHRASAAAGRTASGGGTGDSSPELRGCICLLCTSRRGRVCLCTGRRVIRLCTTRQ